MEWANSKQITDEQKVVLKTLAEHVGKPSLKFLEVGNWLGESTLVLAEVAKRHFGKLYCVDWWKGNPGTELESIAAKEDIFSLFWQRICVEGFQDVVVPIRGSSDSAAEILKEQVFDLIFIDGDHRYEQTLRDIKNYASFVKPNGGILCGHDCEGYIADFDENFLNKGKNIDCHETVHCGVVLAVGSVFNNYSINYSIWSTICEPGKRTWLPTDLIYQNLPELKQGPPPLLGISDNFKIFRFGKQVFAVPENIRDFDITQEHTTASPDVIISETLDQLEDLIGERIWVSSESPMLLSSYRGFNLVKYKEHIYALHESIGPLDLTLTTEPEIKQFKKSGKCFLENSLDAVKEKIDSSIPILVEENYRKFNIVFYRGKYIAVAQDLGKISDWTRFDFKAHEESFKCFVGDSHVEVLRQIDQMSLSILEKAIEEKEFELKKSLNENKLKNSRIASLEKQIEADSKVLETFKKKEIPGSSEN
ncbi:MAG: class I SAM-dependent methyltransferase [Nitrospinota bacterium]|nr:class I SAM-dependent methyltransferase [Nitrospinota bacterium]